MRVFWAELVRVFELRTLWLTALVGVAFTALSFAVMWIGQDVTSADQARELCDMYVAGGVSIYSPVSMIMGGLAVTRDYHWPWMARLRQMSPDATLVAVKSLAVSLFAAMTSIVSTVIGLGIGAATAPYGYTLSTTEPLWKTGLGVVVCSLLACFMGCGVGFILQKRLVTTIVNFILLLFPSIWDGKTAGKYVSWDTLAASLTFDPSLPVKLSFWGALAVSVGFCVLFYLIALIVMRVRSSTLHIGRGQRQAEIVRTIVVSQSPSQPASVPPKINNALVRLTLADLARSRHAVALWALAVAGIAFTCVMTWALFPLPASMGAADVRPYCDSVLGAFSLFSLFCMIMAGVMVTRDYDSSIIAREAQMVGNGGLVVVKALTCLVWCAVSSLVMVGTNMALLRIRLSQQGFTWDASHGFFAILGGNLVLAIASGFCGVGLGFVLRSTIGTVLVQVLAVYVLTPFLARFSILAYIHSGLGTSLTFGATTIDKLAFWQACLVEAGWCAIFFAAALVIMRIRPSRS